LRPELRLAGGCSAEQRNAKQSVGAHLSASTVRAQDFAGFIQCERGTLLLIRAGRDRLLAKRRQFRAGQNLRPVRLKTLMR
jgi:hypothetical protein